MCLNFLLRSIPEWVEVLVLNNGSTDGTFEYLRTINDARVRIFRLEKNVGVSRGYNYLRTYISITSRWIVFLNNDILVENEWCEQLVSEVETDRSIGIVGCKLIYPQTNQIQHAGVLFMLLEDKKEIRPFHFAFHEDPYSFLVSKPRDFPAVTGALLLTSVELFDRVGGWDEDYFLGCEDIDFCLKVLSLSKRIRYLPVPSAYHFHEVTVGQRPSTNKSRNLAIFNKKWAERVLREWPHFVQHSYWSPQSRIQSLQSLIEEDKKRAVVFGTGSYAKYCIKTICDLGFKVVAFVDNDSRKWGKKFLNKLICSPQQILEVQPDVVIIASSNYKSIQEQLLLFVGDQVEIRNI